MKAPLRVQVGVLLLAVVHGGSLFAGFFAPYDFAAQHRSLAFAPPTRLHFSEGVFVYQWKAAGSSYQEDQSTAYPVHFFSGGRLFGVNEPAKIFLLGTDAYGRDQFSRFLYGGRISLVAGLLATALSLALGLLLGGLAGFYGRWADQVVMRAAEIFLALPWLYLLFAVRAFLPLEIRANQVFLLLIAIMGALGWARPARLIRGVVLSIKEREYVLAAKTFGASDVYLLRRHVLPQVLGLALAQSAIFLPRYILAEVALSFFGLGVAEPVPSWGNLLSALRQYQVLESYWWMFLPVLLLIPVFLAYYGVCSYYVNDSAPSTMKSIRFDDEIKHI